MQQVVKWPDTMHAGLSLDEHIAHVLEAAREAVGVDRLHLWAVAPQGDRLLYVASSGLSHADQRSLTDRPEILLEDGSPIARAVRDSRALLVDNGESRHSLSCKGSEALHAKRFLITPLPTRDHSIGVLIADNAYSRAPLAGHRLHLVRTFALHLATAVENARLLAERQRHDSALTESLEQQTATSEILRVISESQHDVQPVFESIAAHARQLCGATFGGILTFDGELIRIAAIEVSSAEGVEALRRSFPMPPGRGGATARAILTQTVVYVRDVREDSEYSLRSLAETAGYRSVVAVPMLRERHTIGAVTVLGAEPAMFSDRQVAMLQTFAKQAVIAIENTRLFNELESRNRDLTQSLERQTATSEVLRIISSSPTDLQPVLDAIAESAALLCDGWVGVYRYDGQVLDMVAGHNLPPEVWAAARETHPAAPTRAHAAGRAILDGVLVHLPDVASDPEYDYKPAAAARLRSVVSVPMMREGKAIGTINVGRGEPRAFSEREIQLLRTFADQAVIAIENTRLFSELELRNRDLTESLEQQTATSEILRAISSSPADLQPVLNTLAESAARLCDASDALVFRVDGDEFWTAAHYGSIPAPSADQRIPIRRDTVTGRVIVDRCVVHVADVPAESDSEFGEAKTFAARLGYRTVLGVPMLRDGKAIGAITVRRVETHPFSNQQIELLKTFADQAVIAIENTRLFSELQTRNRDLAEALAQQTATSEILRVISSSPSDLGPVFDSILENATRLCEAHLGTLSLYDGEAFNAVAMRGANRAVAEYFRR
jgi:GAF domain-containing protein